MIYVTVGTAIGGGEFDRLVKKIDDIAPNIGEDIIVQVGASKYIPKNVRWFNYVSYDESLEYFKKARLVIGHCGSGTMINALSFGVPLIVIPRRFKFAEHSDDHQVEIAKFLEQNRLAAVVYDIEDLEIVIRKMLNESSKLEYAKYLYNKQHLINGIRNFLNSLER